jgi:hypothetical protein
MRNRQYVWHTQPNWPNDTGIYYPPSHLIWGTRLALIHVIEQFAGPTAPDPIKILEILDDSLPTPLERAPPKVIAVSPPLIIAIIGASSYTYVYYQYIPWPNESGIYEPPEPKIYGDADNLRAYLMAYADLEDNEVQGMLKRLGYGT